MSAGPLAIIQARMTSSRLPGKVLLDLHGEPMIIQQLQRIERATSLSDLVVATSTDPSDDELADELSKRGYQVERGPLDDVLARFTTVIDRYQPQDIVRVTADCPLISPVVIDQVVHAYLEAEVDYCSNTLTPTYPDGLDVEVVRATVLQEVARRSTDPHEREHVTLGIYRHPEKFQLLNVTDPEGRDHSDLRWTVDSPDDFEFVSWIYREIAQTQPDFDYPDALSFVEANPERSRTASHAARNVALHGLDTGAMEHGGNQ